MELETLDLHTAGEPLRIVTSGLRPVPGNTMLEKRRFLQSEMDGLRRFLMLEPRGHADMYGAVLTEPVTDDGDVGVLFMHNEGCSTMCGHGIIAVVTAAWKYGLFEVSDPDEIRLDTPAGRITARADTDGNGRLQSVTFRNVPSFVLIERMPLRIDSIDVEVTVAYGGAFYAYVDAEPFGLDLQPSESGRLIGLGQRIKRLVADEARIEHPQRDTDLDFLYGTIFSRTTDVSGQWRNVCIFADGELDRSPTGTGVSGRAAIQFARGELDLGRELRIRSIIGTEFTVRCVAETRAGELPAVIPEVTGSAFITGRHRFMLEDSDPLPHGFLVR